MPGNDWDERFDTAINATAKRRAAYDKIASTGVDMRLMRLHLKEAWCPERNFAEQHRNRLAAVFTTAERLLSDMKNVTTQLETLRDTLRVGLQEEPSGIEFHETYSPLQLLANALPPSILWVEERVLPMFAARISGMQVPKKRRGKQARKKQPILLTRDVHLMILVTYLRLKDRGRPHHSVLAHLMVAAAEACRVSVPLRIDGHWIEVTEERFKANFPGHYANVIKGWATVYSQKK